MFSAPFIVHDAGRNPTSSFPALTRANALRSGRNSQKVPGTPKADVAVHIRGRIVQIQRKRAGVGAIVPIAAAFEGTRCVWPGPSLCVGKADDSVIAR